MLSELYIENIAIIESISINFSSGFSVFTGETGAGKSILIDAIGMILGKRTSKDLIRTGCKSCFVSALFENVSRETFSKLTDLGFSVDEDNKLLISRESFTDGKNICKINGKPCTVSLLRTLSDVLINIHGQHDTHTIFDPSMQMYFIDKFGIDQNLLVTYKKEFIKYSNLKKELECLNIDPIQKARQIDILKFQISEIDDANLTPNEEEILMQKKYQLSNSEKILSNMNAAYSILNGSSDNDGIINSLIVLCSAVKNVSEHNPALSQIPDALQSMTYDLKEFANEILSSINDIESDTENLSTIESRLDIIYKLKRKYGETLDDILQFYNSSKQQLETILLSDQKIEDLKHSIEAQFECVSGLAEEISKSRHDCSKNFADEVSKRLALLDLPSVRFQIHIKSTELTSLGKDYLEFFISTNKGQELRPLTKVASGGELSRIMLAIKNVLSEQDFIDTLIFDEIDTGVSGSTAHNIGVQLKKTADKKQIICVTHSAQIAALADSHFFISKATKDDKTFTSVKLLDLESRKLEIARILGGSLITDSILQSAEEMITNSSYL